VSAPFLVVRPTPVTFNGATTMTSPAINVGDQGQFPAPTVGLNFGYQNPNNDPGITFNVSATTGVGGQLAL
jgi:hypothetical protein